MIAAAELAIDAAARGALGQRDAAQHVVDAPADVLLAQVAPRRPPREQPIVVGVELCAAGRPGRARSRARTARARRALRRSASGLRTLGWTSRSSRATFRSPHNTSANAVARGLAREGRRARRGSAPWPRSLCRRSARRSRRTADRRRARVDDARLVIELGVRELGGRAATPRARRAARRPSNLCAPCQ